MIPRSDYVKPPRPTIIAWECASCGATGQIVRLARDDDKDERERFRVSHDATRTRRLRCKAPRLARKEPR